MEGIPTKIRIIETFEHPFGALMKGERFNVLLKELPDGETIAFINYKSGNSSIRVEIPSDYFEYDLH